MENFERNNSTNVLNVLYAIQIYATKKYILPAFQNTTQSMTKVTLAAGG